MAYGLTFGAAVSDRVDIGSNASIENLTTWTALLWVRQTTLTDLRVLLALDANNQLFRLDLAAGNIEVDCTRATTSLTYTTSDTPLASAGAWKCVAATVDHAGSAGELANIYHGNLTSAMAESTYGTQTDGAGAFTVSGTGGWIGNTSALTRSFQGDIGPVALYNRVLSLAECEAWRLHPSRLIGSGCVGFWILGNGGSTGTQADLSGNTNDGTVTGATAASTQLALALHGPLVTTGTRVRSLCGGLV